MYTIIEWLEDVVAAPAVITDPARLLPSRATEKRDPYWDAVMRVTHGLDPRVLAYPVQQVEEPTDRNPWAWKYCEKCQGRSRMGQLSWGGASWKTYAVTCMNCHGRTKSYPDHGRHDGRAKPYGGSWHTVKGQIKSNLIAKHKREHNKWLKQVDRMCRENPTSTFVFKPKACGKPGCTAEEVAVAGIGKKVRSIDDAMVQLQLLGVNV